MMFRSVKAKEIEGKSFPSHPCFLLVLPVALFRLCFPTAKKKLCLNSAKATYYESFNVCSGVIVEPLLLDNSFARMRCRGGFTLCLCPGTRSQNVTHPRSYSISARPTDTLVCLGLFDSQVRVRGCLVHAFD